MTTEWPPPHILVACYFIFINSIAAFFATSVALMAYFRSSTIRQCYQNLLLLNLLLNALLYSMSSIIIYGHGANKLNVLSIGWVCNLNGFFNLFCCGMENYTLMCIALERYFAIKRQKPLTLVQIIGMLIFGYCYIGVVVSILYWNSSYYFAITDPILYCTFPYYDRSQLIPCLITAVHVFICIFVICYCYIGIYRFYRMSGRMKRTNVNKKDTLLQSNAFKQDSQKKEDDKEFRVFLTTVLIIGWTLTGWSSMFAMIMYQLITGKVANEHWEMMSGPQVDW